jgi:hypothetical protein
MITLNRLVGKIDGLGKEIIVLRTSRKKISLLTLGKDQNYLTTGYCARNNGKDTHYRQRS